MQAKAQDRYEEGVIKRYGSLYADIDLAAWLRQHEIDPVTLVGYVTNNCIRPWAVEAEFLGFNPEVLSDATGAINLANDAGFADAITARTTLLTLLNSNWAAASTTDALENPADFDKERSWRLSNSRGRKPDQDITGLVGIRLAQVALENGQTRLPADDPGGSSNVRRRTCLPGLHVRLSLA